MVETRRQRREREWQEMVDDTSEEEDDGYDFDNDSIFGGSDGPRRPRYRPNDHCNRHRGPDDEPYSVQVTSYRRRSGN